MTAAEFIEQIKDFAPSIEDIKKVGLSDDFAVLLSNEYKYAIRDVTSHSENEIDNLINNYDLSKLAISLISFNKQIIETEDYRFFGDDEADLLGISNATQEIVMTDHEAPDFVMLYCAANPSAFLDALLAAWRTLTAILIDDSKSDDKKFRLQAIKTCSDLAGGDKYHQFYYSLIGE